MTTKAATQGETPGDDREPIPTVARSTPPPSSRAPLDNIEQDEADSSLYGIEYAVLAATLLAAFFLLRPQTGRVLQLLYHPYLIFLILVMFMEYIVLRARDRSYMLEKELEQQRELQQRRRVQLEEVERELDGWRHALEHAPEGETVAQAEEREQMRERVDYLIGLTKK